VTQPASKKHDLTNDDRSNQVIPPQHSTVTHHSCHSPPPSPFPLPRTMSSPPLYSSAHPAVSFGTLGVRDGHFIGGTFVTSQSKATFDVVNPSNGQVLASAAAGDADDIHAAIEAAHACWRERSWAGRTGADRSVCFPTHHSMAGTPSLCSTRSLIWEYARSKDSVYTLAAPPASIPLLPFGIHRLARTAGCAFSTFHHSSPFHLFESHHSCVPTAMYH
jgi:hypothetical protein